MPTPVRSWAWVLLSALTALLPACTRLIAWPEAEPDQDFLRRHIAAMEVKPFDGVVLQATVPGLEGSARVFTWSALARRYSMEELRPVVETLRQVPFRRFRHNFLRVNVNPTDRPFDMFDDEPWDILIGNLVTAAAAAREAGLRGLLLDPEAYADPEPGSRIPRFNVFDFRRRRTTQEFPVYRQEAFHRGRAVGRAVTEAYPGITLLLAFGPSASCLGRDPQPERTYGLLGSFVDGLLAGAGGRGTVVEGFEYSYPYRSCDRFQEAYAFLRGPCRELSLDPRRYDQSLEIGFGIWLDFDSGRTCQDPGVAGRPCRWFDPSLYPPERRDLVDPEQFARAVGAALSVSDGYVWIYTTEPKWWTEANPLGENLPEAYVQALARARGAAPHACPRPGPIPPGGAVPESNR
ncbi:MAG: hypothetical protein HYS69_03010 [candidate division NC10 bacterium]|nr:hypothetical protein [candidate division NC10 bacterium]